MREAPDDHLAKPGPEPGAGARAGAAVDQLGRRLGALALGTGAQLRDLAARVGGPAGGTGGGQGAAETAPSAPPPQLARADAALDRVGVRLGGALALVGWQVRRAAARTREEAEDLWAEAQRLRQGA